MNKKLILTEIEVKGTNKKTQIMHMKFQNNHKKGFQMYSKWTKAYATNIGIYAQMLQLTFYTPHLMARASKLDKFTILTSSTYRPTNNQSADIANIPSLS